MDDFVWFVIVVGVVLCIWIYKLIANRGFRGAMFGAPIRDTVGEVDVSSNAVAKEKMLVYRLESADRAAGRSVGLEIRFASWLGSYDMRPIALTRSQARALSEMLAKASQ